MNQNAMNQSTYREPAKDLKVLGHWDVIVAGGGPAGCAAAWAAARRGARTLIVEKSGHLGGQTVDALVCAILSTNGVDFQGVWHDWIRALRRRRGDNELRRKGDQMMITTVYPEAVKYAWDDLLSESGVEFLHHAHVGGAIVEEGVLKGVILDTRAGRQAAFAKRVVDGTGHGIVCHEAGVPWEQGDGTNKWAMALTKVFRLSGMNWDNITYTDEIIARAEAELDAAIARGEFVTPVVTEKKRLLKYAKLKLWDMGGGRGQIMSVLSRVLKVDPLDPWDFTRAEREGRAQAWEGAEAYRRFIPGCENAYLLDTSYQIGVRSTRRVQGLVRLTDDDAWQLRKQSNSIARSSWDIDIWPADSYTKEAVPRDDADYKKRHAKVAAGDYFDIPYGCIVAAGVDNLLMAGQCLSASHVAESSLRIQQTCMATGQAAGTAAAMSIELNVTPRELDPEPLLAQLAKDRDVEPAYAFLGELPVQSAWQEPVPASMLP
jgi:succinate dehydrogenase/fumarate reductase flavoprotein subunit